MWEYEWTCGLYASEENFVGGGEAGMELDVDDELTEVCGFIEGIVGGGI